MIAVSVKASRLKSAVGTVILGGVIFALTLFAGKIALPEKESPTSPDERKVYLEEKGYTEIGEEKCVQTLIPYEWNETYTEYNTLQTEQGFDLSRFKGENAERYIFKAKKEGESVEITLIILDGKIIGADAYSYETGEMTPV